MKILNTFVAQTNIWMTYTKCTINRLIYYNSLWPFYGWWSSKIPRSIKVYLQPPQNALIRCTVLVATLLHGNDFCLIDPCERNPSITGKYVTCSKSSICPREMFDWLPCHSAYARWAPNISATILIPPPPPIKWKHFSRYWPFVRGIHRSPVDSPHKGQWRKASMFPLIYTSTNGWVNNRETGDLKHYRDHYDVTVM